LVSDKVNSRHSVFTCISEETAQVGSPTCAVIFGKTVIKGWDESVIDMSIGEIAKIHCSPDYAYGPGGFPAWGIMPNSELVFEIEVLSYA
jgi:FKBP-type peptidyl-prolyl cis-trans isomerase